MTFGSRLGLVAVAALAAVLSLRRPALRSVALALAAIAGIDCARAFPMPPRASAALWCAWPGVAAALAWRVWKSERPEPCAKALAGPGLSGGIQPTTRRALPLLFLAPAFVPLLPLPWSPLAWAILLRAPHLAAVAAGLAAWAGRRPRTAGQAVALALTFSAALDLAIGALAPGAGWARAAPLAWATWVAVGLVLGWEWTRSRGRRGAR